jgi:hypothetical protein
MRLLMRVFKVVVSFSSKVWGLQHEERIRMRFSD